MAVLTTKQRKKLPSKEFALPGKGEGPGGKGAGSYPINDPRHARNALARVAQHGTPAEKSRVRAAVKRKYPSIGQSKGPEKKKNNPGKGREEARPSTGSGQAEGRESRGSRDKRLGRELESRLEARSAGPSRNFTR